MNFPFYFHLQISVPAGSNTVALNEALSPDSVDPDNVASIGVVVISSTSSTPSITGIQGTVCCNAGKYDNIYITYFGLCILLVTT